MQHNSGFTLIELILVVVIIGILASMMAINFTGFGEKARINAAKGDITTLETSIDLFALEHNDKYPQTLQELVGRGPGSLKELKNDPWTNPYIYSVPGKHNKDRYDLISAGPDGQQGTADDITNWETGNSGT